MEKRRCIYCREEKIEDAFNREHVLPESFGTYDPTPILTCVCQECNSKLGREIISPFLRRSFKGLLRYGFDQRKLKMGASEQKRMKRLDDKHISFDVTLPPLLQKLKGLQLVGMDRPNHGMLRFLPQIGLWSSHIGLPEFFTIEELETKQLNLSNYSCRIGNPAIIACETEEEQGRLVNLAKEFGADIEEIYRIPFPFNLRGELRIRLGSGELRLPAYIAFNVAAYYLGADVVLDNCFDEIRNFIDGESSSKALELVSALKKGSWIIPQDRHLMNGCHLVTIEWDRSQLELVAHVSLFNIVHYKIFLTKGYRGIWRPDWRFGRVFNWQTGEIGELRPMPDGLHV